MTSKYPQMTTHKKASGQSPTKTIKGGSDFDKLLQGKSWLDPDKKTFEQLLKQPRLKKLPLKYVLRRGIARLNPVDLPVRTAINLAELVFGPSASGGQPGVPPAAYWQPGIVCAQNGRGGFVGYRREKSCTNFCGVDPTGAQEFWTNGTELTSIGMEGPGGNCLANRYWAWVQYTRKAGAPVPTPLVGTQVPVGPVASPNVGPTSQPVAQPQPKPQPTPLEKARPGEEPAGEPDPDPVYDLPVFDAPVVLVNPNGSGVRPQPRTQTWTFGGGLPPRYRDRRGNPRNRRPNRRTKQAKPNIVLIAGRLWVVINAFTEGLDFVEVLWESLPKEMRRDHIFEFRYDDEDKLARLSRRAQFEIRRRGGFKRAADHQSMLEDLWKNWAHVDVAKTLTGYINNQVEDWFYGLMGKPTKALTQALGAATGVDHAIANAQKWSQKMYGANEEIENQYLISELLPTVDFDPHTGDVTLTSPLGEVKFNLGDKVF